MRSPSSAVVLYHFWPARFSGGYVGVDIFFVISGFLITAHLMRELTATGTVRLGQFWARRARRLLPASLLVLLFCALVAMSPYLTPTSALPNEVREILASTFYVENWYLALNSADYLNHGGDPTTVQHYWSLSLEEQFYVMWPLIMLLAAWIAVKWFRGARRRAVILALGVVTVVSFVFCVIFTITNPAPAYFVTFGRMWQFGVGAMVALIPALRIRHAIGSFVLGWAGIAVLRVRDLPLRRADAFPGLRGGASDARARRRSSRHPTPSGGGTRLASSRFGPRSSSATSRTRCTCGTGRSSSSPRPCRSGA